MAMAGAVAEIAAVVQLEETEVIMPDVVKQRITQDAEIRFGSQAKLACAAQRVEIVPELVVGPFPPSHDGPAGLSLGIEAARPACSG